MAAESLEVGDLIWAKMRGFPPWPARIADPELHKHKVLSKKNHQFVHFFGTDDVAWILSENISAHSDEMLEKAEKGKKKTAKLKKAIQELKDEIKERSSPEAESSDDFERVLPSFSYNQLEESWMPTALKTETIAAKTRLPQDEEAGSFSKQPSTRSQAISENKNDVASDGFSLQQIRENLELNRCPSDVLQEATDSASFKDEPSSRIIKDLPPFSKCRHLNSKFYVEYLRNNPPMSVVLEDMTDYKRTVTATKRKIGVLGSGEMVCNMIKKLSKTKHQVTFFQSVDEPYPNFSDLTVIRAASPLEVSQACAIIFCFIDDPQIIKRLILSPGGVLTGFKGIRDGSKGFVQMATIDPLTSRSISAAIIAEGGTYLETFVYDEQQLSNSDNVIALCAGFKPLFKKCDSCLHAMFEDNFYFFGENNVDAGEINILMRVIKEVVLTETSKLMVALNLPVNIVNIAPNRPHSQFVQQLIQKIKVEGNLANVLKQQMIDLQLEMDKDSVFHPTADDTLAASETGDVIDQQMEAEKVPCSNEVPTDCEPPVCKASEDVHMEQVDQLICCDTVEFPCSNEVPTDGEPLVCKAAEDVHVGQADQLICYDTVEVPTDGEPPVCKAAEDVHLEQADQLICYDTVEVPCSYEVPTDGEPPVCKAAEDVHVEQADQLICYDTVEVLCSKEALDQLNSQVPLNDEPICVAIENIDDEQADVTNQTTYYKTVQVVCPIEALENFQESIDSELVADENMMCNNPENELCQEQLDAAIKSFLAEDIKKISQDIPKKV